MDYRSAASLQDRVAIVTGAAGGIGFEASKALQDHVDRERQAVRTLAPL